MTTLFKIFRRLFSKQFDAYIIDRTLRTAADKLTSDQNKYLLKLNEEGMMLGILNTLIATFVRAGMKTRTEQGFMQMGDWVTAITHLKDLIIGTKSPEQHINPLTQAPYKNPNDKK